MEEQVLARFESEISFEHMAFIATVLSRPSSQINSNANTEYLQSHRDGVGGGGAGVNILRIFFFAFILLTPCSNLHMACQAYLALNFYT